MENYSHGMNQRLVVASALLHDPQVLVVHEPMVGMDPIGARLLKSLFRSLAARGKTIFMSTHSLEVAEELCDRIGIILGGKLVTLVTLTNYFLGVSSFIMILSAVTLFFLILGVVSLSIARGIAYPKFDFDNVAQIPTGFGGVVYMILCISFIGVVIILEAWPVYMFFLSRLHQISLSLGQWISIFFSFALAFVVCGAVFWFAARWSLGKLEEMEI